MKKTILVLTAACTLYMLPSCNNAENNSNKVAEEQNEKKFDDTKIEGDAEFAAKAAGGGMMEVDLGNYAAINGSSTSVKDFGRMMAADHAKANEELKALAQSKNISLPAVPDNDMQKKMEDIKKKTGADFDRAYADLMVSDHKDDVDHFQKEADKGNDADLKAWAGGKVGVLQHHLQMAEDMKSQVNK